MDFIYPEKIVDYSGNVANVGNLLIKKELQIGFNSLYTEFTGKSYVVLDFGKEISGGARILNVFSTGESNRVRLRFGESVSETMAELGYKNATNDHSPRDFDVILPSYSDGTFGSTGFRFLRIDFPENGHFSVKTVCAASDVDKRPEQGLFETSDNLLNKIRETAAYTLRLNLKNGYIWDGIKRDRLVWVGDLFPEIKSAYTMFSDVPEIKNSLDYSKDTMPKGTWMNGIPMYSAWWMLNVIEHCIRFGDYSYIVESKNDFDDILGMILNEIDEDGTTHFPMNFIDWPSHFDVGDDDEDKRCDEIAGMNYLLRIIISSVIEVYDYVGFDKAVASEILTRLSRKNYEIRKYKQIAAMAVLSGDKSKRNLEVLEKGGTKGLTTFLNYFIFSALAKYGKYDEILGMIREYYGKMLELGATTFWEDFDVEWAENAYPIDSMPVEGKKDIHGDFGSFCYKGFRHSLCHGWASSVIGYLSEYVLGIKQVGFDGKTFEVNPHISDLGYVKGVYPTPFGNIEVFAEKQPDGSVKTTVNKPDCIKIV